MRVAIVHDWLLGMRGGERALDVFCKMFPAAEIFTLFYNKTTLTPTIENRPIHTSFLQGMPFAREKYRNYLPLFPLAVESFDLKGFDLVISSSHCVAKGARKPKNSYHLCYCYTPMRYVWVFFEQYFGDYSPLKKMAVGCVARYLKKWDLATLPRVDDFIGISHTIKRRIKDVYNREAAVIYPPVDIENFRLDPSRKRGDYYLCVSALVPYKRIDIIIDAFNILKDKKIVIVGDGNLREDLERRAVSGNIKFAGRVSDDELAGIYRNAKAFVFAAEEDFGIAPIEAQAVGVPVICYGKGGLSETIIPINSASGASRPTGMFFYEQSVESFVEAINKFEAMEREFNPSNARLNAERFSEDKFRHNIRTFINDKMGKQVV